VFINFLSIAQGSLSELDTQLELCVLLEFRQPEGLGELQEKLTKVDKMLTGLIRSLQ
jgi:four helix bundle protein